MLPERALEIQRIREAYGPIADRIIAEQAPFLDLTEQTYGLLKLDFCTVGYFGRNYMQFATHISIRLPECVVIRRSLKRSQTVTASR